MVPPAGSGLAVGTWGGDNAGVIVDDSTAHVHVGCTNGDFTRPITLDSQGRFTATGSYQLRAYPVVREPPVPALFTGVVAGDRLTLTIAVDDTIIHEQVTVGPATVKYAREPRMQSCPICRTRTRE